MASNKRGHVAVLNESDGERSAANPNDGMTSNKRPKTKAVLAMESVMEEAISEATVSLVKEVEALTVERNDWKRRGRVLTEKLKEKESCLSRTIRFNNLYVQTERAAAKKVQEELESTKRENEALKKETGVKDTLLRTKDDHVRALLLGKYTADFIAERRRFRVRLIFTQRGRRLPRS